MTLSKLPRYFAIALVAPAATLLAGAAVAGTRAPDAIPKTVAAQAAPNANPSPNGPKNGFPDSPGLDRAREVANENARFKRTDSNG